MKRDFHFLGEHSPEGFIQHDRDEVRTSLMDMEGALFQLGGVVVISALREEVEPGTYVTTGVLMTYESFTPAVSREPEEVAES
jgi:hypothetical protein